jgi:hypothetical protein
MVHYVLELLLVVHGQSPSFHIFIFIFHKNYLDGIGNGELTLALQNYSLNNYPF